MCKFIDAWSWKFQCENYFDITVVQHFPLYNVFVSVFALNSRFCWNSKVFIAQLETMPQKPERNKNWNFFSEAEIY